MGILKLISKEGGLTGASAIMIMQSDLALAPTLPPPCLPPVATIKTVNANYLADLQILRSLC